MSFYARNCLLLQCKQGIACFVMICLIQLDVDMNQMPPITKNLLIINILFYLAILALERNGIDLSNLLGLHFLLADNFHPWQLFTYMFMHASVEHVFFNMFALWMFGRIIEQTLGQKRFLTLYVVCGVGAGLCQEIAQYVHYLQLDIMQLPYSGNAGNMVDVVMLEGFDRPVLLSSYLDAWATVGASGAVYGILLAFGMLYPNDKMFIIPIPVPIKAKYLIAGYALIELLSTMGGRGDNVAHVAHLGGMLFAIGLILYWKHSDRNNNRWGGYYDRGF